MIFRSRCSFQCQTNILATDLIVKDLQSSIIVGILDMVDRSVPVNVASHH